MWQIPSIFTGQRFPAGTHSTAGTCQLCKHPARKVARTELKIAGNVVPKTLCAECVADVVVGAPALGARVFVESRGPNEALTFREVSTRKPPSAKA